jgi:hypothetical protein
VTKVDLVGGVAFEILAGEGMGVFDLFELVLGQPGGGAQGLPVLGAGGLELAGLVPVCKMLLPIDIQGLRPSQPLVSISVSVLGAVFRLFLAQNQAILSQPLRLLPPHHHVVRVFPELVMALSRELTLVAVAEA